MNYEKHLNNITTKEHAKITSLKRNLQEISLSPLRTLTTHKTTQARFLEGNKGKIEVEGRVGRGIYRAGKPVGAARNVLKTRGRSVLFAEYHIQLAEDIWWSLSVRRHGPPCVLLAKDVRSKSLKFSKCPSNCS